MSNPPDDGLSLAALERARLDLVRQVNQPMPAPSPEPSFANVARDLPPDLPFRLYVWYDPYPVHYGESQLVAVATSLEDAKRIAAAAPQDRWGSGIAGEALVASLGEPDQIIDAPGAVWSEWSE